MDNNNDKEIDTIMLRQQLMKLEIAIASIQDEITRMSRKVNTIEQIVKKQ